MTHHLHLTAAEGLAVHVQLPGTLHVPPEWPLLAAAYVVGAREGPAAAKADITLVLKEAATPAIHHTGATTTLCGPWGPNFPADIYHVLHTLARAAWMQQGLYAAHAACVVVNGRVILLVGPSGSGKSTVALHLLQRGAHVFSGNTTLLGFPEKGGMQARAGTDVLTLKAGSMHASRFPGSVPYGNRLAARFPQPPPGPLAVDAIAVVRLNDGVREADRLSPASALHTLYPVCMDAMNADVLVGAGMGVISPAVAPHARSLLANHLARCVETLPVWHLAGSLAHITQILEEGL